MQWNTEPMKMQDEGSCDPRKHHGGREGMLPSTAEKQLVVLCLHTRENLDLHTCEILEIMLPLHKHLWMVET